MSGLWSRVRLRLGKAKWRVTGRESKVAKVNGCFAEAI
jgi:hypothetical protein